MDNIGKSMRNFYILNFFLKYTFHFYSSRIHVYEKCKKRQSFEYYSTFNFKFLNFLTIICKLIIANWKDIRIMIILHNFVFYQILDNFINFELCQRKKQSFILMLKIDGYFLFEYSIHLEKSINFSTKFPTC